MPTEAALQLARDAMKSQAVIQVESAKLKFLAATPEIAQAMVDRATGDRRDSQRAGERILEQVGVLQKEPLVIIHDPSQDVLAKLVMLMAKDMAKSKEEPAKPSIEVEVREVFGIS